MAGGDLSSRVMSQELWYVEKNWPYGVCCPSHSLGVKDDGCGSLATLKVTSGKVVENHAELRQRLLELYPKITAKKWSVDLAFYRNRGTEESASTSKKNSCFGEMYVVQQDEGACYVCGRQTPGIGGFEIIAIEQTIAKILIATNFEDQRPRAAVRIQGESFSFIDKVENDLTFRIGTLHHSGIHALLLAVRFNALPSSHPGAMKIERQIIELWCQGRGEVLYHPPLHLENMDLQKRPIPISSKYPFHGVDHLLSLLNCFRTTLFGTTNEHRSRESYSSASIETMGGVQWRPPSPSSSIFPSSWTPYKNGRS